MSGDWLAFWSFFNLESDSEAIWLPWCLQSFGQDLISEYLCLRHGYCQMPPSVTSFLVHGATRNRCNIIPFFIWSLRKSVWVLLVYIKLKAELGKTCSQWFRSTGIINRTQISVLHSIKEFSSFGNHWERVLKIVVLPQCLSRYSARYEKIVFYFIKAVISPCFFSFSPNPASPAQRYKDLPVFVHSHSLNNPLDSSKVALM